MGETASIGRHWQNLKLEGIMACYPDYEMRNLDPEEMELEREEASEDECMNGHADLTPGCWYCDLAA